MWTVSALACLTAAVVLWWTVRRAWSSTPPQMTQTAGGVQLLAPRSLRVRQGGSALLFSVACLQLANAMRLDPGPRPGRWITVAGSSLVIAAYAVSLVRHGNGRLWIGPEGFRLTQMGRNRQIAWRDVSGFTVVRTGIWVEPREGDRFAVGGVPGWGIEHTAQVLEYLAEHSLARRDLGTAEGLRRWSEHVRGSESR